MSELEVWWQPFSSRWDYENHQCWTYACGYDEQTLVVSTTAKPELRTPWAWCHFGEWFNNISITVTLLKEHL